MKVLIATPDNEQQQLLNNILEQAGFTIDLTTSSSATSERIHVSEYDCIILSTSFNPSLLTEILKQEKNEGIIMISSTESLEEKVKALREGADDFIILPTHPEEISARIYALIRRKKFHTRTNIYFGNLTINIQDRTVLVWDKAIAFTRKEIDILLYLISNKDKVVQKEKLSEYLWSEDSGAPDSDNALIAHIKNIRKKLTQEKTEVEIKNIYGIGYQIIEL
jgi:DNA-binding response OmpR family regulator